jgi:hypothetical protein
VRSSGRYAAAVGSLLIFAVAGCGNPHPAHIEALTATRREAPGAAWQVEEAAYRHLTNAAIKSGWRVVVTPITDRSLAVPPLFDTTIPAFSIFGENEYHLKKDIAADRSRADQALRTLWTYPGVNRTEILAAVNGAADRFEDDSADRKVLVIISTGYEQSSIVNMADYNADLYAATRRILHHMRVTRTLPRLSGVSVCMAGITSGQHNWADLKRSRDVRHFWHAFFSATGARLVSYGVSLEGCGALRG